jgi:Zn-dependent metalloprotease
MLKQAVFAILLMGLTATPSAWSQTNDPKKAPFADFDARDLVLPHGSADAQIQANRTIAQRTDNIESFLTSTQDDSPGIRISPNRYGLPKLFLRDGGSLSVPSKNEPEEIAKSFLRDHAAIFPFTSSEINSLRLASKDITNEATFLTLTQTINGIDVFNGQIKFTLNGKGEVMQVGTGDVTPGLRLSTTPKLTIEQAIEAAIASIGGGEAGNFTRLPDENGRARFSNPLGGRYSPITAELVIFPLTASSARLTYQLYLEAGPEAWYEILIDANDGSILYRHNIYVFAAQGRVWLESPMKGTRQLLNFPDGWLPADGTVTKGNNTDAYLDSATPYDSPDPVTDLTMQNGRAFSTSRVFDFDFGDGLQILDPRLYPAASVTNLFYFINVAHDYFYNLGFTEASGNFQTDNFGRGGMGNDAVLAEAQQGSYTNNAAFGVTPEGIAPKIRMGIFTRGTSSKLDDLDSDYDGQVVIHEYAHGVSTRIIGTSCLAGPQSGALGEGWSDYFSISYFDNPIEGAYVTQNSTSGVRRQSYENYSFTYEDIGNAGYEVHNDGEIWAGALWDLRKSLGASVTDRLVMNGIRSTPCTPSFVSARDSILTADQTINSGSNRAAIWQVFARHGLGYSAVGTDGSSSTGLRYDAAYDLPPDLQATKNPAITSNPLTTVPGLGDRYTYQVIASNPNGGVLNFVLSQGPSGMIVDPASGSVNWTVGFVSQRIKITVTDGKGGKVVHGYLLPVSTTIIPDTPITIDSPQGKYGVAYVTIPSNVPALQVTLRNGSGSAYLMAMDPSGSMQMSLRSGSTQTLSFANPKSGLWHIETYGATSFSGVSLAANLVTPKPLSIPSSLSSLSGLISSESLYKLTIPAQTNSLTIATSGGTGDVDIFLRKSYPAVCQSSGSVYEPCQYDYRSAFDGNAESISVSNPAAGDWYLDLSGYQEYSGVTLNAVTTGAASQLQITTESLASGQIGIAYSRDLAASGGTLPYRWQLDSGSLPPGLTLSTTGTISGTPTTVGSFNFMIRVADSAATPATATKLLTLTIESSGLTITTLTLPSGLVGVSYSYSMAASGGTPPYLWQMVSGTLPLGLSLSTAGVIAGTATAAGTANVSIRVTDSAAATSTRSFTISILSPGSLIRTGILSHFAAGGEWDSTISLINSSSSAIPVRVAFHDDNGNPLSLPFTVVQQGSSQVVTTSLLDRVIDPMTTLQISAGRQISNLVVGWADVFSSSPLGGHLIFRYTSQGTASEGTVPLQKVFTSSIVLPFNNALGFSTGFALINGKPSPANITASVWDENGSQLVIKAISIPANGHKSFMIYEEFPVTVGKNGIVVFSETSGGILGGLAIRISPYGTFTSLPAINQ